MMRKLYALLVLWLVCSGEANSCTIFMAGNGKSVLVGNNEDYIPTAKSYLWVRPGREQGNGYVFWGFKEKYPEGGMNDKGLFIDAAALPEKIAIVRDPHKPDFNGYITEKILRECSSVEEAVNLVSKYNLTWQEKAQIMIVDKSGDYAIIHANYIIRKTTPLFVLTNYSLNDQGAKDFTCWRRNTAYAELTNNPLSVDLFRNILSKTAQTEPDNATVYSQVCDLQKGLIYLYRLHNYTRADTISIQEIILKGRRDVAMSALFPQSIGDVISDQISDHGMRRALIVYDRLKGSVNKRNCYDFSEPELDKVAYKLLNARKFKEAIVIFKLNIRSYPLSANAVAGLANALLVSGEKQEADRQYKKVMELDRSNYYLGLFQHHADSLTHFRVYGFDGARKMTIFLKGASPVNPAPTELSMSKKGEWVAVVKIPPGEYSYSFKVDDSWITDPGNKLTKMAGQYANSYLISR